jgi:hypothetical protein
MNKTYFASEKEWVDFKKKKVKSLRYISSEEITEFPCCVTWQIRSVSSTGGLVLEYTAVYPKDFKGDSDV